MDKTDRAVSKIGPETRQPGTRRGEPVNKEEVRKIPEADIIMETRKGVAVSYAPAQIAV